MTQNPRCDDYLLKWKGDGLEVTLRLDAPRKGRAVFRGNFGAASVRRQEIIAQNDRGETPLAKAWNDREMAEVEPGLYRCVVPLDEVGVFSGKCCFFPAGKTVPEWPEGANFHVKVEPAETRGGNSIYTVFPRQFGSFREVARRLDFIMDTMGFRIIQTLPVFPVPTTYAVMGEYGCPFAATDFFSVDPAMAEFDKYATPLDQFRELIDAVHAKGGRLFVDLPANHTGWASTLQTHHPDWFHRASDGRFVSPGAWGVTWDDLVELDYRHPELRAYMAEVFLFWVRNGVDGFRCDAGYMIPAETWTYIVARVREEYPDTVFMLEGLGGKLEVTDRLLRESGLDWAYSEIFQTYDRGAFEWYLPGAIDRARAGGTLVHFAETHDNDRLAKGGETWSRLRVALAALLSHQGAWGIANGVEWFATEKIDVHGKNDLNWGASRNQVAFIAKLNALVSRHPDFQGNGPIRLVQRGDGNFLAAVRGSTLILANLDCGRGTNARWDASAFPVSCEAFDLLQDRQVHVEDGMWLEPGEVRALCAQRVIPDSGFQIPDSRFQIPDSGFPIPDSGFRIPDAGCRVPAAVWTYPQDCTRDVCVPAGCDLEVCAPHPFRVRVTDGVRTFAVERSRPVRPDNRAILKLPPYAGDGTRAGICTLDIAVYAPDGVQHRSSRVLLLPTGDRARVKLTYTGTEIRRNPELETVLSNGAGAASRVRLAWGEVRSQYDALFAANTNPNVPADRLALWTRCRCWLQHEGYSRELNRDCIETFRADPAGRFAKWTFRVPCGMGHAVRFDFTLALAEGANAARLTVQRLEDPATGAVEGTVRLVFRPDLEWRSFHGTTKAQGAVEAAFGRPGGTRFTETGFTFAPYADAERLEVTVAGGTCHDAPEWTYCVGHPEEAARGQDGSGDLYSPGWIACDFAADATASITAEYVKGMSAPAARRFASVPKQAAEAVDLPTALKEALKLFIVKRDDVKTVLAGFPWFLDWGRDTFIFLQGAIPGGFRKEALEIAEAFARFEENGTLPNIIYGETAGNRDTVDAPLWFIRTLAVLGKSAAKFRPVAESIVEHYLTGTPNGIRVDADSGLVWSPSHFTWMDTNYPACTPRMGYPVEIQALWIAALRYLGGPKWDALADRAAASLVKYFSGAGHEGLADCLDAPNGEPAAAARPDWGVRPNQLFAVSLGAVDGELARSVVRATERLVVPGGVRSLAAGDGRYRGVYAGDEDTSRKPAYHNGTVWAWPFPLFAEALAKTGLASRETALSLLASAVENLNAGCVCHVSEIADADAPHAQKGCRAQAWSASELLRVWLELSR